MAKFGDYLEETTPSNDDLVLIKENSSGATKRVQLQNILPAGSVGTTDLADTAVTTAKIANAAVTPAKMLGVDLLGVTTGSLSGGTVPAAGTGQFYMQAGNVTVSTNSNGDATITLPTAFPNGIIAIVPGNTGSIADDATVSITPASLSAFNVSSPQKSASVNVSYIAIGW